MDKYNLELYGYELHLVWTALVELHKMADRMDDRLSHEWTKEFHTGDGIPGVLNKEGAKMLDYVISTRMRSSQILRKIEKLKGMEDESC